MPIDTATRIRRLEKRLFNEDFAGWAKREAYDEIIMLVTRKWQERVKQLEDRIQRNSTQDGG